MSANDMRGWPLGLRLNAAAARLASALYYAKCEVWGSDGRHFDALTSEQKQAWIVRADEFLKTVQPAPPERKERPTVTYGVNKPIKWVALCDHCDGYRLPNHVCPGGAL